MHFPDPGDGRASGRWSRFLVGTLLSVLGALLATEARAIGNAPRTGDLAIAFAAGVDRPLEAGDAFDGGYALSLSAEMYWTAAKSIRGTLGSLDLPARDGSGRGNRSGLYLAGNFSYNWLRRAVFPYVTGGIGIYAMEEQTEPAGDEHCLEAGLNAGAGVEFRLHRVVTLRLEGLVHALTGDQPRTLATATLGVKFYF